jgi:hypothetical protein
MAVELKTLQVTTRRQWRGWLTKHHRSSSGIWFVFYKAHTGRKSILYEDMVREALCFGWIDSLVKRLDDDRYAIKVTPRKPTSKWSNLNRKRWQELNEAGLLSRLVSRRLRRTRTYAPRPVIAELPDYIAKALKTNSRAWNSSSDWRRPTDATSSSGSISREATRDACKAHSRIDFAAGRG